MMRLEDCDELDESSWKPIWKTREHVLKLIANVVHTPGERDMGIENF